MNKQLHETVSMHEISFTPSQLGKKEEKKKHYALTKVG